jgi:hypothetical protein
MNILSQKTSIASIDDSLIEGMLNDIYASLYKQGYSAIVACDPGATNICGLDIYKRGTEDAQFFNFVDYTFLGSNSKRPHPKVTLSSPKGVEVTIREVSNGIYNVAPLIAILEQKSTSSRRSKASAELDIPSFIQDLEDALDAKGISSLADYDGMAIDIDGVEGKFRVDEYHELKDRRGEGIGGFEVEFINDTQADGATLQYFPGEGIPNIQPLIKMINNYRTKEGTYEAALLAIAKVLAGKIDDLQERIATINTDDEYLSQLEVKLRAIIDDVDALKRFF